LQDYNLLGLDCLACQADITGKLDNVTESSTQLKLFLLLIIIGVCYFEQVWLILFRVSNTIHEEYANLLELEKLAEYLLKGFVELNVVALTKNVLD
jgi:hypothetical protein